MGPFNPELLCLRGNPELQDRIEVFNIGENLLIALADGAGGTSGGAQAAEEFIRIVSIQKEALTTPNLCAQLLQDADLRIQIGETTALLLVLTPTQIYGASVGDSEARIFHPTGNHHLTAGQIRKPLLGSAESIPVPFEAPLTPGHLIIATDGLWKYTSLQKITAEISVNNLKLPERLANLVRLRSGALQDDLALATLRLDLNS